MLKVIERPVKIIAESNMLKHFFTTVQKHAFFNKCLITGSVLFPVLLLQGSQIEHYLVVIFFMSVKCFSQHEVCIIFKGWQSSLAELQAWLWESIVISNKLKLIRFCSVYSKVVFPFLKLLFAEYESREKEADVYS